MQLVDANHVLRWFLGDVAAQAATVEKLLATSADNSLVLDRLSAAEVTYVLRAKGYDHKQVATVLREFCRYPSVVPPDEIDNLAIELFAGSSLDFEDCWLAAKAHFSHAAVATFDKQLLRMSRQLASGKN